MESTGLKHELKSVLGQLINFKLYSRNDSFKREYLDSKLDYIIDSLEKCVEKL